jgi:hypothetical protein
MTDSNTSPPNLVQITETPEPPELKPEQGLTSIRNKRIKQRLRQKRWNETVEKLRKNICPQCDKIRSKLDMYPTELDSNFDDSFEVQIIMCNKCLADVKNAQNDSVIQYKDMELEMKDKDIKILKLKLDFYSDSDGDVYSDDDSDVSCDCEERGRRNQRRNCDYEQSEDEENEKVFSFKNLKIPIKKLPKKRSGEDDSPK